MELRMEQRFDLVHPRNRVPRAKVRHETSILVRECTLSNLDTAKIIDAFKSLGVKIVHDDLFDHHSLEQWPLWKTQNDMVMATICEKLPSDSVMLVYLSTSGKVGRNVAPTEYMGGSKKLSRNKVHELRRQFSSIKSSTDISLFGMVNFSSPFNLGTSLLPLEAVIFPDC
ncbi:hypothetical protein F8388_002893 [Cannabis sativa]|uniref:Uncharacterized protein n=1 Tax=Cannabis sativa TaxID=3483 RepID=A0A7J6DXE9_CANSA|nr:hypothetical protein F8388_002893 [Cannabis sativa]